MRPAPAGPVIFMLPPKTGGTALRALLERVYAPEELHLPPATEAAFCAEYDALPAERKRRLRCIGGHVFHGLHARLEGSSRYATVLREPVERVISHWDYVRRRPAAPLSTEAEALGVDGFVRRPHRFLDNCQVRYLSGVGYGPAFGAIGEEHLRQALDNLAGFAAVALTERLEEGVELFRHVFVWPAVTLTRENVSPGRPRAADLSAETRQAILESNRFDRELHLRAGELFERMWAVARAERRAAERSALGRLAARVKAAVVG